MGFAINVISIRFLIRIKDSHFLSYTVHIPQQKCAHLPILIQRQIKLIPQTAQGRIYLHQQL